ncbi:MAG: HNH endonuclease [Gemmatales bacterium]
MMNEDHFLNFINDPAWDAPFFKRLANNDTGNSSGNQAGFVVPIPLRQFFPELDQGRTSPVAPTVDRLLVAELFDGSLFLGQCSTRYQFQTWGGERSPESRITGNLGPLLNRAHGGDLLILQRSRERTDAYRMFLIQSGSVHFETIDGLTNGERWAELYLDNPPLNQDELQEASAMMLEEASGPFISVRNEVPQSRLTREAIARDTAFRELLLNEYDRRCCISELGITTGTTIEPEAAHVVGLGFGGADEPRNGFLLTRTLHWCFDQGLFGINDDRRVVVPDSVRSRPENQWLMQFDGRIIRESRSASLRTSPLAFQWHRENLLAREE